MILYRDHFTCKDCLIDHDWPWSIALQWRPVVTLQDCQIEILCVSGYHDIFCTFIC